MDFRAVRLLLDALPSPLPGGYGRARPSKLPIIADDNLKRPGAWDSGYVMLHESGRTACARANEQAATACCADGDGDGAPAARPTPTMPTARHSRPTTAR